MALCPFTAHDNYAYQAPPTNLLLELVAARRRILSDPPAAGLKTCGQDHGPSSCSSRAGEAASWLPEQGSNALTPPRRVVIVRFWHSFLLRRVGWGRDDLTFAISPLPMMLAPYFFFWGFARKVVVTREGPWLRTY